MIESSHHHNFLVPFLKGKKKKQTNKERRTFRETKEEKREKERIIDVEI